MYSCIILPLMYKANFEGCQNSKIRPYWNVLRLLGLYTQITLSRYCMLNYVKLHQRKHKLCYQGINTSVDVNLMESRMKMLSGNFIFMEQPCSLGEVLLLLLVQGPEAVIQFCTASRLGFVNSCLVQACLGLPGAFSQLVQLQQQLPNNQITHYIT